MTIDPTKRFTPRVSNYVQGRPGYPASLAGSVASLAGLCGGAVIADLGSGTGLLAEPFLAAGFEVIGVEPNTAMRQAGDDYLEQYGKFRSIDSTAEKIDLPANSVDMVTAGQAFHWFDPYYCGAECRRICRNAYAALVWNERSFGTAFMQDYEDLLREHAPEYAAKPYGHIDPGALKSFFRSEKYQRVRLENLQHLDLESLARRVFSSSYTPAEDDAGYAGFLHRVQSLFRKHEQNGRVTFQYDLWVIHGSLD